MPQQVVIKDIEFLKMIIRGYTSAYAIHRFMEKEAEASGKEGRVITYKNIGERILRLAKDGFIEVTEIDQRSIHGRKDYRLTSKGIQSLMPDTEVINKEDVKALSDYVDKTHGGIGQYSILLALLAKFFDMQFLLEEHVKRISQPELMPLKRALMKDLAPIEFKELFRFSKSDSELAEPVRELPIPIGKARKKT